MKAYRLHAFDLASLRMEDVAEPQVGAGQAVVEIKAISLNYRDLLVIRGQYNPKLKLPVTPMSDGAGVVIDVGPGTATLRRGDRVVTHFVPGWSDGPFRAEYPKTSLGTPGPGVAAERVVLPESALVKIPDTLSYTDAATLPIAALTAWSCLMTEGGLTRGQDVLTLGTGGVSIFAVQLAATMGARVIITSGSDAKLSRAGQLGAQVGINYRTCPEWDQSVLEATGGQGVDLTIETGGAGTLERSLRATKAGGKIAFLGALTGLKADVNLAPLLMKRLHILGIYVDCRAAFVTMLRHFEKHAIKPVIDRAHAFENLPEALQAMDQGLHFGKIVVTL